MLISCNASSDHVRCASGQLNKLSVNFTGKVRTAGRNIQRKALLANARVDSKALVAEVIVTATG